MELVETTPEKAFEILTNKTRKIVLGNGREVTMINLNNQTCFAEKNNSGSTYENENVKFFIKVPKGSKTVF